MKFKKITVSYESNMNKATEQFVNVDNVVRIREGIESAIVFLSDSTNIYIPLSEVNILTGVDEPSQMTIFDDLEDSGNTNVEDKKSSSWFKPKKNR